MNINGVELAEPGDMVVSAYRREGSFEPAVMREWIAALDPGKAAIDVGAYSGLYAIAAAQRGINAIAWEPNPVLCQRIRENAKANNVRLKLQPFGAGRRARSAFLVARFPTSSAGHLVTSLEYGKTGVRVDVYPVTSAVMISVVKIDVEGAERDVLDGMAELIDRDRPVVITEALSDGAASDIQRFFVGRNYRHEWLDARNLVFRPCAS